MLSVCPRVTVHVCQDCPTRTCSASDLTSLFFPSITAGCVTSLCMRSSTVCMRGRDALAPVKKVPWDTRLGVSVPVCVRHTHTHTYHRAEYSHMQPRLRHARRSIRAQVSQHTSHQHASAWSCLLSTSHPGTLACFSCQRNQGTTSERQAGSACHSYDTKIGIAVCVCVRVCVCVCVSRIHVPVDTRLRTRRGLASSTSSRHICMHTM